MKGDTMKFLKSGKEEDGGKWAGSREEGETQKKTQRNLRMS